MATVKDISAAAKRAADWAIADEPNDSGMRARLFVVCLQGYLAEVAPEIAGTLERLRYPGGRPSIDKVGG